MKTAQDNNTEVIVIRLSDKLKKRWKRESEKLNTTISELTRHIIKEYLSK